MLYTIGHKNPDTDAICSPLVRSVYMNDIGTPSQAIRLGELNKETLYVLSYAGVSIPELQDTLLPGSDIFLLDHNEYQQSIDKRETYTIQGLIDHHAFGDFVSTNPLYVRVEAVGCTCTVIQKIFKEKDYIPNQSTAILMISAIISDTLMYKSPTTTDDDKKAIERLQQFAKIPNLQDYAMQMFAAKSDLGDMDPMSIITLDYKVFTMGTKNIGVGVMETTNPSYALTRKQELIDAIYKKKQEDNLDALLFCVVDIVHERNTAFIADPDTAKIVSGAFAIQIGDNDIVDLGSIVSRKKQIIPVLTKYLS